MTASDGKRQKILLIDPTDKLKLALSRLLTRFNYDLLYASTPQLSFPLLHQKSNIALAIISHDVSGLPPLDTVHALRRWQEDFPVILLTPNTQNPAYLKLPQPTTILPVPVNLGQLLLAINRMVHITHPQASEEPEEWLEQTMEARVLFTVLNVSESGCCLRSHFPLKRNSILVLDSPELANKLQLPAEHSFPLRICNCVQSTGSRTYSTGAQFIGMTDDIRSRLRSACLSAKGFKFNGSRK